MPQLFKIFAYLPTFILFTSILVSCGGGGGGGENKKKTLDLTPLTYSGNTNTFIANRDNAEAAGSKSIQSFHIASVVTTLAIRYETIAAEEIIKGQQGGEAHVVSDGNGEIVTSFYDYRDGALTLHGQLKQSNTNNKYPSTGVMTLEPRRLTLTDSSSSITIDGKVIISEPPNAQTVSLSDFIHMDNLSGNRMLFKDFKVVIDNRYKGFERTRYTDMNGLLFDSDLGKIEIKTIRSLIDLEYFETLNSWVAEGKGLIQLNNSLQLMAINRQFAALLLDENSDTHYETSLRVSWAELNKEEAFIEYDNPVYPIPNPGYAPLVQLSEASLIHGLFSRGNGFIQLDWRLLIKPLGSQFELSKEPKAYFDFVPDMVGTYVFELQVTDGKHTQKIDYQLIAGDGSTAGTSEPQMEVFREEIGDLLQFRLDDRASIWRPQDLFFTDIKWFSTNNNKDTEQSYFIEGKESYTANYIAAPSELGIHLVKYSSQYSSRQIELNLTGTPFMSYIKHDSPIPEQFMQAIHFIDMDNDQVDDMVTLWKEYGETSSDVFFEIEVCLALPDGEYNCLSRNSVDSDSLFFGDLNNDNYIDVVTKGESSVFILSSNQSGQLLPPQPITIPLSEGFDLEKIAVGDANADGLDDIVAFVKKPETFRELAEGRIIKLLQNEEGEIEALLPEPINARAFHRTEIADMNNDNRLDVVVANVGEGGFSETPYVDNYIQVYISRPSGFELSSFLQVGSRTNSMDLTVGDYNNDGLLDIVYLINSSFQLYKQTSESEFVKQIDVQRPPFFSEIEASLFEDFDGDGDVDVAFTYSGNLYVAMNKDQNFNLVQLPTSRYRVSNSQTNKLTGFAIGDYNKDGHEDLIVPGKGLIVYYGGLTNIPERVISDES